MGGAVSEQTVAASFCSEALNGWGSALLKGLDEKSLSMFKSEYRIALKPMMQPFIK
jgi:hypothetical protein